MIDESERLVVGLGETFVATGGSGWLIQCRSVQHCSLEARELSKKYVQRDFVVHFVGDERSSSLFLIDSTQLILG